MAKQGTIFVCDHCGYQSAKWLGQCPECGEWGTLKKLIVNSEKLKVGRSGRLSRSDRSIESVQFLRLSQIKGKTAGRIKTGISELDRVLGGGIVPGSVVLFAGEPGIGKSTLLTQVALALATDHQPARQSLRPQALAGGPAHQAEASAQALAGRPAHQDCEAVGGPSTINHQPLTIIYICGEESPEQVRLRTDRISASLRGEKKVSSIKNLFFLPETDTDLIVEKVLSLISDQTNPSDQSNSSNQSDPSDRTNFLLIVDSIQTLYTTDLPGTAGSISQVRESTQRLIELAKTKQIPVFLVGHVTKKGVLAGPKTIEHAVDTVLYFEGERSADLRLLRSVKNRFGPTDEVGVFQMTDAGLKEVTDPTNLLNSETLPAQAGRNQKPNPGSAYSLVFEGTRPMLVEIQALVTKSFAPLPKRVINGLDRRRSEMLIAVLQKYLKIPLWQYDVFLNVAGGFKVFEPAADLAVCAALYSSYKSKPLPIKSVFVGEVSLLGEVNPVSREERRQKQARALGLKDFYSAQNLSAISQLRSLFSRS